MKRRNNGFTLMEVLIALAIVGIMTAVALPMYGDYVLRSRLTEAFAALGAAQPSAEQFWSNGRTFEGFGVADGLPSDTANFGYALGAASASAYTITATGTAAARGFVFTIDQGGTRATTAVPEGWVTNATCWVDRRDGSCTH